LPCHTVLGCTPVIWLLTAEFRGVESLYSAEMSKSISPVYPQMHLYSVIDQLPSYTVRSKSPRPQGKRLWDF